MRELVLLALSGRGLTWITKRTYYWILSGFTIDVLGVLLALALLDQVLVLPFALVVALAPAPASLATLLHPPCCVALRN